MSGPISTLSPVAPKFYYRSPGKVTASSSTAGLSVKSKSNTVTLSGKAANVTYILAPRVTLKFGTQEVSVMTSAGDSALKTARALRKALPAGYDASVTVNKDKTVSLTVVRLSNTELAVETDLDGAGKDGSLSKSEIKTVFKYAAKDGFTSEEVAAVQSRMTSWLDTINGGMGWGAGAREEYQRLADAYGFPPQRVNRDVLAPPGGE